ncbi:MAG: serine/threonine protein kinase, partial [Pirellula sp.]
MNYKIACPLCQHSFSIKDPKPGKYKPKCSACSQAFALVVESGDPVQIKVGKLAKTVAKPMDQTQDVEPAISPPTASDALQATLPGEVSHDVSGVTSVSGTVNASSASGLDATMERSDDQDFSVNEATMDSNVGLASASSASKNTAGKNSAGKDSAGIISASKGASVKASEGARSSAPAGSNASSPALMLNRLGGYKILSELGAGGMGSVYLAKQISLDRSCALKTIQAHWAKNPRVIARFIREAYAAAQLTHHNVVQIYDLGQDSGTNYFSMELVSGGSLDDQLKSKGKLPPKLAATLILQASRGLKFAHDHGMVHRDIKPANLMMTADGLVKVADMGLIKTPSADDLPPEDDSDVQSMMLASARSQVTAVGS